MTDKEQIDIMEAAIVEASQVYGAASVKDYFRNVANPRFVANELADALKSLGFEIIETDNNG